MILKTTEVIDGEQYEGSTLTGWHLYGTWFLMGFGALHVLAYLYLLGSALLGEVTVTVTTVRG